MISSGALPNVAFRKPPMPGPVWSARLSVASPISHDNGIERRGGEHEQRLLAGRTEPIQEDDDRPEEQQRYEKPARLSERPGRHRQR